jgi:hypothetical protein
VESTRPLDEENSLVTLALRVVNQSGRAVALARVQTVCRAAPEASEQESAPAAEPVSRPAADGSGAWAEDVLSLYGGEAFL